MNSSNKKGHALNLQLIAAVGTWAVIFGLSIAQLWEAPRLFEAIGLQLLLLVSLLPAMNFSVRETRPAIAKISLFIMLGVHALLISRIPVGNFFVYSIVWISVTVNYFRQSTCWALLVLVSGIWWVVRTFVWQESDALMETMLLATFHVFALISSTIALRAQQANEKTQTLNRELLAAQHLLSEVSKTSERTRISREIHDLLGHHLTALTINLQIASRITQGDAKDKIDQCHGLAKLLLSDVREAVSTLRESSVVNLNEVLSLAIKDVPRLDIALKIESPINLDDVALADVLLRCVQESITNSLKHSKAQHATIVIWVEQKKLLLSYKDDGHGVSNLILGNGLKGMRERVEKVAGNIVFIGQPNMQIKIELPLDQNRLVA